MFIKRTTLYEPQTILETGTKPLLVVCDDNREWICKHFNQNKNLLFNEYLASRFAKNWNLLTPEISQIHFLPEHIPEGAKFMLPRKNFEIPCFGSQYIDLSTEFNNTLLSSLTKLYNKGKVKNKPDLLKVCLFDMWLSNEDRNQGNPNLLLNIENSQRHLITVIDHDNIFNGNNLDKGIYQINHNDSLINSDYAKIFFRSPKIIKSITNSLLSNFPNYVRYCEAELQEILNDAPLEWNIDLVKMKQLLSQLFTSIWIDECENNFRTLIQSYLL